MPAPIRTILTPLASLKLTVILFVFAMVLIFAGTLAQRFEGNWEVVNKYFRSTHVWMPLQLFVPEAIATVPGAVLFPGGFIIGGLLLANLLAAHAVRFKLSWKRAGVLVIHAGLILLLVGEAVTAFGAHEANMTIDQGSYANFTENLRRFELAIVDPSDPQSDRVVVIPSAMLARAAAHGEPISDTQLPFAVRVDRWMGNSAIAGPAVAPPDVMAKNPVTAGLGRQIVAIEQPPVTGVEQQTVNAPSAIVTLLRDGKPLDTYLVSLYFDQRQPVTVDGRTYELALRFERDYKPYTMHLIEFRHDKFVGTEIPKNFSSQIRLVDPTQNEDREVLIWMNHPLRYNGETFYQSAFKPGNTATILQVVRNPGWLLPYISCVLVGVGMIVHFGVMLVKFTGRSLT